MKPIGNRDTAAMLAAGQKIERLSGRAQPLARIVDSTRPNSPQRIAAARELCRVVKRCLELAVATGNPAIIETAQSSAARVREMCPVEAADVGL